MSADLDELGRTQVLVVCGGVKSILDVPKTLEALETRGVAVAALGTRDFPAFFSLRSPGVDGAPNRAPLRVDSAAEAAARFGAHRELGLAPRGCVLAVPNPAPLPTEAVEAATRDALAAARDAGVAGADATPFLLADLERRTAGRSLDANVVPLRSSTTSPPLRGRRRGRAGAAAARPPARRRADAVHAAAVAVCSDGRGGRGRHVGARRRARVAGGRRRERREGGARAAPTAPRDDGRVDAREPRRGRRRRARLRHRRRRADVRRAARRRLPPSWAARRRRRGLRCSSAVAGARVVVVDANLSKDAYAAVLTALDDATELWFEPTSTAKAAAAFAEIRHRCDVVTPNEAELAALLRACGGAPVGFERDAAALAQRAGAAVIATRGARGAVLATRDGRVAALPAERVAAGLANGAGHAPRGAAAARAAGRPPGGARAARARPPRAASSGARIQPRRRVLTTTTTAAFGAKGTALKVSPGCLKSGWYANSASSILMPRPWNSRARS